MRDRNKALLMKIARYAEEIRGTIVGYNVDFAKFKSDHTVRNAIAMCVLQIGELTGSLTDDFKAAHNKALWKNYTRIRNRAAHAYSSMDMEILWGIAVNDIPVLKDYCNDILGEMKK
jgi:uncharacterized protein with HEPN domain